jgi:nitroimidazol reductase NimA-like FMN-containing flavoprotein (pyridoxamine 5'-phosphate oxidase superfamily)
MSRDAIGAFLEGSRYGRLATIGDDGYPYCVPLLYIVSDGEIFVHNTSARGHLRSNVERHPQVCFEIDEAGSVFDYGRFECDSSIAYRSVVVFGRIRIVEERAAKQSFCDALMQKYGNPANGRPKGFYPRLDQITVYGITIERMTGKELALPDESERWPVKDNTRTPNASPD